MNHITLEKFSTTYEYVRGTVQGLVQCEANKSKMSNLRMRFLLLRICKEVGGGHKPATRPFRTPFTTIEPAMHEVNGTSPFPPAEK